MKLITEHIEDVQVLTEEKDGRKRLFIEGIFLQGGIKNRNGRIYPPSILEREVERYNTNYVKQGRAYGELGHPDTPTINLERASHIITELRKDGHNYIGKAVIIEEGDMGRQVKAILNAGGKLGVSSRGVGSLKMSEGVNVVQDDFMLSTAADIVADPSAPDAFVNGIMEGKEWVWDNGIIKEVTIAGYKAQINEASSKDREDAMLKAFSNYLNKLTQRQ